MHAKKNFCEALYSSPFKSTLADDGFFYITFQCGMLQMDQLEPIISKFTSGFWHKYLERRTSSLSTQSEVFQKKMADGDQSSSVSE